MKKEPDVKTKGVKYVADSVVSNSEAAANSAMYKSNDELSMENYYKFFVDTAQGRRAYKKIFNELLTVPNNEAVLWHCSHGKDRAGFGTALILTALGFDKSTIYKDYLLSNKYNKKVNDEDLASLKKSGASASAIKSEYYGDIVEKQYLDTAYKEAEKHYGSLEGYITKGLGISAHQIQQLRAKYLEK